MKKLIVVLMLAGIVWGQAKPKWHNPDAWRKKLRKGLAEQAVISVLGKPVYARVAWSDNTSMRTIWYYGEMPNCTV